MNKPETTYSADVNVYFDADAVIARLEQKAGKPMHKDAKEILRGFEKFINEAYRDGYRAGREAVLYG